MDGIWTHIWAMLETIFLLHQLAITEVRLLRISSPGVEVSSPLWNLTQITAASGKYSWCSFLHPTPTAPTPLASFYFLRLLSYGMVQIYTKVEWYNDVRVISPTFKKYHLLASLFHLTSPPTFPLIQDHVGLYVTISAYSYLFLGLFPPLGLILRSFSFLNPQCLFD